MRGRWIGLFVFEIAAWLMVPEVVHGAPSCDFIVPLSVSTVDGQDEQSNYSSVKPGDTICLAAGDRGPLTFQNIKGTASSWITIVNKDGQVVIRTDRAGIKMNNCAYLRISGSGVSSNCGSDYSRAGQDCGIQIIGAHNGIWMEEYRDMHGFEIDHIAMKDNIINLPYQGGVAFKARGQKTLYDVYVHHNHFLNIDHEAIYLGTDPPPGQPESELGYIDGAEVSSNLVERSGFDGINIKMAKNVKVHHNIVKDTGLLNGQVQHVLEGGIKLADASGDVYNNLVINSWDTGIANGRVSTSEKTRIYNNVVIGSKTDSVRILDYGLSVVYNNTIVNSVKGGIVASGSQIFDNLVVGGNTSIQGNASNNYRGSVASVNFVNSSADNYRLTAQSSVAIDKGRNTGVFPLFDYDDVLRPQGGKTDLGAFEYRSEVIPIVPVEAVRVVAPMVIDGDLSDWEGIPVNEGAFGYALVNEPASDVSGRWQTAWDGQYLYVGVKVTDDVLVSNESANIWDDDGVEIFVDGDRDGQVGYDGNDHQYTIDLQNRIAEHGAISGTIDVEHAVTTSSDGYVIEVAIPWDPNLGQSSVPVNQTIGFDLGINDDDDWGSRDNYLLWFPLRESKPANDSTAFGEMVISDQVRYRVRDFKYLLAKWFSNKGDQNGDGKVNSWDWANVISSL